MSCRATVVPPPKEEHGRTRTEAISNHKDEVLGLDRASEAHGRVEGQQRHEGHREREGSRAGHAKQREREKQ